MGPEFETEIDFDEPFQKNDPWPDISGHFEPASSIEANQSPANPQSGTLGRIG